jgi:lipocalin
MPCIVERMLRRFARASTALYTDKEAQSISINATCTQSSGSTGSTVQVNGSASITTKVAGFPSINFNGSSTTTWAPICCASHWCSTTRFDG